MANLFLTDIPNNAKKSTETIYEIKAPLATFDTIDLDDWDEDNVSRKSVRSNERTPTTVSPRCDKNSKQEKQLDPGIETIEKAVTVEKACPVSSSAPKVKEKKSAVDDHNVSSVKEKVKKASEENHSVNANLKENKKAQKANHVSNKTKDTKTDNKNSKSEVVAEKSKHKEHGMSSVKTRLGKILSPKSDSKRKVGELKLQKQQDNGSCNTTPVEGNGHRVALTEELDTPTPTEDRVQPDNASVDTLNSESENNASVNGSQGDLMDPNSSENNASAEDIQTKLKQKGRKHKEKASNVRYEKIGSMSDISDHEKSESTPSFPALKLKSKVYDSDSDSSDSDSGYIRRGYIANVKGIGPQHLRSIVGGTDFVDSDSTPCSSPKASRPVIPPPLSKEDAAKISKRKAYEKRLQRLQVTTTPIERPRSTTPINIHGLEEYISISSPERSPAKGSHEKLKIKLPLDDLGRSPRHLAGHRRCASGDGQVFNFNEELLFTHTKSAILLEENGHQTQSPKRIFVPPTLSPKLSPAHLVKSPRSTSVLDPNHPPKYFFNPKSPKPVRKVDNTATINAEPGGVNLDQSENTNWAKFDDVGAGVKKVESENPDTKHDAQATDNACIKKDDSNIKPVVAEKDIFSAFDEKYDEELNKEEILTVNIVDTGDTRQCDIECHAKEMNSDNVIKNNSNEIDVLGKANTDKLHVNVIEQNKTDESDVIEQSNTDELHVTKPNNTDELDATEQNNTDEFHVNEQSSTDEKLKIEDTMNSKGIMLDEELADNSIC